MKLIEEARLEQHGKVNLDGLHALQKKVNKGALPSRYRERFTSLKNSLVILLERLIRLKTQPGTTADMWETYAKTLGTHGVRLVEECFQDIKTVLSQINKLRKEAYESKRRNRAGQPGDADTESDNRVSGESEMGV